MQQQIVSTMPMPMPQNVMVSGPEWFQGRVF